MCVDFPAWGRFIFVCQRDTVSVNCWQTFPNIADLHIPYDDSGGLYKKVCLKEKYMIVVPIHRNTAAIYYK